MIITVALLLSSLSSTLFYLSIYPYITPRIYRSFFCHVDNVKLLFVSILRLLHICKVSVSVEKGKMYYIIITTVGGAYVSSRACGTFSESACYFTNKFECKHSNVKNKKP